MYPIIRLTKEKLKSCKAPELPLFGEHVSSHICWPQDIDVWMELNNGRTLTLFDLGRIPLMRRNGIFAGLKKGGWGMTVAGSSVRYRRRVRPFDKVAMRSRLAGADARFLYVEQSMWRGAECTSHTLVRMAVTDQNGIVPVQHLLAQIGHKQVLPPLPAWIAAWCAADAKRPWPPMQDPAGTAETGAIHAIPQRNERTGT